MTNEIKIILSGKAGQPKPKLSEGYINVFFTERLLKVFKFIGKCIEEGNPPSVDEVKRHLKCNSRSSVQYTIAALIRDGFVMSEAGRHRSMRLTEFGNAVYKAVRDK